MDPLRFFSVIVLLAVDTLVDVSLSLKDYRNTRTYKHGDIILGGLFPLHLVKQQESCSDLRPNVLMYAEAMMFAVDEINKNSSILTNVTLGYDIRDTCGDDQEAVTVVSDFVFRNTLKFDHRYLVTNSCVAQATSSNENPILAVIGGLDSRISVNVANVLQVVDVPQVSYGASSAELSDPQFTSFFRTVPVDKFQSLAMAELVAHYKWTCVAVIGVDDWYGRSGIDAFVSAANDSGICIVMRQLFPVHDSEDLIPQVITRLKSMDHVQIIILYSLVPEAIKVFEEALKQGMTGKTWIASDGWAESALISQEVRFKPVIQGAIGFGFHGFPFKEFEQHIIEVGPLMDKGIWWNEFWQDEFTCSAVNYPSPFYKQCSGTERISLETYARDYSQGVIPYVRDAVYSVAYALRNLLKCNSPGASCSDRISALRPDDLLRSLKNLSAFQGITGRIDFQRGEVEAAYDIYNLQETPQGNFDLVKIGFWNMGREPRLSVRDDLMQWHQNVKPRITCGEICKPGTYRSKPNQCFWECVPCDLDTVSESLGSSQCTSCPKGFISNQNKTKCEEVPVRFVKWGEAWGIALSVLTAGCVSSTLVVMAIVVQKRQTPIIRDTGGILNNLLLVLVILAYMFNFINLNKLSDTTCRLLPPIFYFVYTGGALVQFLKVCRIRALLKPLTKDRSKVILFIVAALWFFPVFVALIWIIADPPKVEKQIDSRLIVYAACKQHQNIGGMILRYFCACYLAAILIGSMIVAYSTKGLPRGHRFDEAKHVAFSLTVFAVTFATFYPGWSILVGPSLTVFACLTNLAAATGTLVCIFAPKLWLIYRFPHHNTQAYILPALPEVREANSHSVLSIGRVAVALGTGERHSTLSRSSPPGGSPTRGSPKASPKGILKQSSRKESVRNSPNDLTFGGTNRSTAQMKTYL